MHEINTDQVDIGKFIPHGRVCISAFEPDVLLFRAEGPFNQEFVAAMQQIYRALMQTVVENGQGNWAEIILFESCCMATEGLFEALSHYVQELKVQGVIPIPKACAFVISPQVEGARLMRGKFSRCYSQASINCCTFETLDAAARWVRCHLDAAHSSSSAKFPAQHAAEKIIQQRI